MDLGTLSAAVLGPGGRADLPAALAIFVQEAGVPLPVPVGAILLFLGYRSTSQPALLLGTTIVIVELVTIVGTSVKYWFGLKGGRPLLYTYGRFVRLGVERLHRGEHQFRSHGTRAVVLGRTLPGLSTVVPLAAGALGMPYRRFLPAVAIGSGINIVVLVLVGFWAGGSVIGRLIQLGLSLRLVVTLALLAATAAALVVLRRRARLAHRALPSHGLPAGTVQRGLVAGFLAMFEMGIGINLALYAMALVGLLEPQHALLRFLDLTARLAGSGQVALVALLVLFLAGGVVWALLYTAVAVRYLPGPPPVRGLLFSALPFAVSMGLLAALGFGPLGLGLGAGLIPCAGELTRCGLFGAGLGTAEQMVRDASGAA